MHLQLMKFKHGHKGTYIWSLVQQITPNHNWEEVHATLQEKHLEIMTRWDIESKLCHHNMYLVALLGTYFQLQ